MCQVGLDGVGGLANDDRRRLVRMRRTCEVLDVRILALDRLLVLFSHP